jgi:hypothetical protein
MKFLRYIMLVGLTLVLAACGATVNITAVTGSGTLKTEEREIGDFTAINLSGMGDVILTQGEPTVLSINAEDNLLPYLESVVEGGTLYLRVRQDAALLPTQAITYTMTVPNITAITVSGTANIMGDNLMIEKLALNVSGGGSFLLSGTATELSVTISGAGSFDTSQLITQRTTINMTGAGSARVSATELLDVTISGAGTIFYSGSPEIRQNISGIGEIKQMG